MRRENGKLPEEELTREIIGGFFYVYNTLRFGFLESVYSNALAKVLTRSGHTIEREARVPVWFEQEIIGHHRLDMIVDRKVVVEIKATERLPEVADRQLRSYLNATQLEVGLILHFGVEARAHRVTRGPRSRNSRDAHLPDPADLQDPQSSS